MTSYQSNFQWVKVLYVGGCVWMVMERKKCFVSTNHPSISLAVCAGRWCCIAALLHVRCFHSVCPFCLRQGASRAAASLCSRCIVVVVAPVAELFFTNDRLQVLIHMLSNCGLVIIGFNHTTSRLVTLQVSSSHSSSVSTPLLSLLLWKTVFANLCRRDLWFSSEIFCF
jgi:hypothetical protein